MYQELSRPDVTDVDIEDFEPDDETVRTILAASGKLQSAVVAAEYSTVCDRILDGETLAALTDPARCPHDDASERCELRRKALTPYFSKRLICVVINLPGVTYTIEIDPSLARVIHWEFAAT